MFAINLLADTSPGQTWVEGVLDLEAEEFTIEHVRGLRRALARFSSQPIEAVRIGSIARWMPIIVLGMPAAAAEQVVQAFERSDPALLDALGGLALCSLKLDAESSEVSPTEERRRRFQDPKDVRPLEIVLWLLLLAVFVLWMVSMSSHSPLS